MTTRTLASVAALALTGSLAHASIVSVSGTITQIGAPPSALAGALASFQAFAWNERTNINGPIFADETQNPGTSGGAIAGTLSGQFDSHVIHFESLPGVVGAAGTVTFNQPIVGVIFQTTSLDNTDGNCGALGTLYPTFYPFRQFTTSGFNFTGNVLNFQINSSFSAPILTEIRVLTHAVPAPGSLALLGLGGALAVRRRR